MKKSERGIYLILTVVALPLLLALGVFSYDLGRLYLVRSKLQNVSDLAALAAMRQYLNDLEGGLASTSQANVFHAADVTIQTNDSAKSAAAAIDVRGIRTGKYDPAANPAFQALNIQNAEINAVQVEVAKNTGGFLFKYFFGDGAKHDIAVKATVEVQCPEGFKWGGERCCPPGMKWDGAQKKCIGECPPGFDPVPGDPLKCTRQVTTTSTETVFECPAPECAQKPPPSEFDGEIRVYVWGPRGAGLCHQSNTQVRSDYDITGKCQKSRTDCYACGGDAWPSPLIPPTPSVVEGAVKKDLHGHTYVDHVPDCTPEVVLNKCCNGKVKIIEKGFGTNPANKFTYAYYQCLEEPEDTTTSVFAPCKDLPENATECSNAQGGLVSKAYLLVDSPAHCIASQCQAYCDASKSLVREGNKCVAQKKEAAPAPLAVTCRGTAGSGRDVHWTASASGGSGSYEYDWGIEIEGNKMFSGWTTSSSHDLPSSPPVIVTVRDKNNPSQTSSSGCTAA